MIRPQPLATESHSYLELSTPAPHHQGIFVSPSYELVITMRQGMSEQQKACEEIEAKYPDAKIAVLVVVR